MSLKNTQDLLRQYNEGNPYTRTSSISPTANQNAKRFGTWSYANTYDALYEKYSQNRNFNMEMWHQAIKLGEQDQYLAFLEQNKDSVLSKQFYDPQYYDYEAMMLEMYKPFANAANKEERFTEIYDPVSQKWTEESLGEMSDQQYIQYQLDQTRQIRAAEITRDLEQWRKDQLGFWGQLGHDVLATRAEFGEGLLSGLTGIIDFVAAVGTGGVLPYAMNDFEGNYLDAFVDYFGENGLTAAEKHTVRAALDEYERTHTHFRDIDGNMTGVGKYVAGIANSIGMMVPAIVANYFTGGIAGLSWVGSSTFYASIFSNNMYENATNPNVTNSPSWLKITNAAVKTGAEAVIEWGLGQALGRTIQNQMIGLGGGRARGQSLFKSLFRGFSKTSGLKYFFKSAAQEGLEEFLQDFSTNCVDQFTDLIYEGYGNTGVTFQTLIDSFCIGMLSSMFMSGGHVAFNTVTSAVRNQKEAGSGDLLIETKDGPQKVTGLNRLYYSSILSDFQQAVDQLKRGKIIVGKNIELAQEVYGAVSAISQFYSSFDAERIKNCEMLLDRVVKAERSAFEATHPNAAAALAPETVADILKNDKSAINKKMYKQMTRQEARTFAYDVEATFRSMVGGVALRHAEKLRAAADKKEEALKKAGATEATSFTDTDGLRYQKDPDIEELERRLGKKGLDNLDELRKGYEWVITVDGHIACETDGFLFVSEAWLQNYETSDIYKYLEQTRILETLASDKMLAPMVKKLIAFDKKFTGQTDVDAERALMDLLFNKSVYQAFLLSNAGKNMHEFKAFIFQLHEIVKDLGQRSKYHQQLFKGKQAQKRINMLNQIYAQIKETMWEPTIKAILNWHIDPQVVGADSVLTERDRQVINQYEQRRRVLSSTGADRSAYENLKEDIIAKADFNDEELALVRKSGTGELSIDEETEARALLEEADRRMTRYDFEISPKYSLVESFLDRTRAEYMNLIALRQTGDVDISLFSNIVYSLYDNMGICIDPRASHSKGFLQALEAYEKKAEALFQHKLAEITEEDIIPMINLGIKIYERALQELSGDKHQSKGLGAFVIPYQAAAIAMNDGDIAGTQFVTDQLNEFKRMYGISARQMIMGDLTGMSMQQRNQLTQDMEILEVDGYVTFVIKKLEGMFGGKYTVTPTRKQLAPPKQITDASTLSATQEKVKNWLGRVSRMIARNPDERYTHERWFFNTAEDITPENYKRVTGKTPPNELVTFWNEYKTLRKKDMHAALVYLTESIELIDNTYDALINTLDRDYYERTKNDTNVYDFVIVKSVPAEAIISADILTEDVETRNSIFRKVFTAVDKHNRDVYRRFINSALNDPRFKNDKAELMYLSQLSDWDIDNWLYAFIEHNNGTVDIINPETREVLTDTPLGNLFAEMRNNLRMSRKYAPLSEFIDISLFPSVDLDRVFVYFEDAGPGAAGWAAGNRITIDPRKSNDYFGTLVHEVNHILQNKMNMPGGFNNDTALAMPDFLAYVVNHYPNYIRYTLYRAGYDERVELPNIGNMTEKDIKQMPTYLRNLVAHCGYMLVQGELWARAYMHNGKMVHGFTEIWSNLGKTYLLAPDGKTKFEVRYDSTSYASSTSFTSDVVAGSALDTAIQKLFLLKGQQERRGYAATSRNTYHSGFTKSSALEMTQQILSPDVPWMVKYSVKLGDIIRDPQSYLAPEILAMCNGDFSEGNVFYRIKEYVEANVDGVSIDITSGPNPQYVWVDDNAFDDLLLTSIKSKVESQESTLATKYKAGEHISLTEFYSTKELARLGINPSAYIVISPNVATETVFDNEHRTGAIFIKANKNTTDAKIIDSLNHEFRHLLQRYNGFATGFTPDFKVSREMIEDVKKHVPGLFKNETVVRWAKALADTKADTTWEEVIVQRFVYYTTSGELNAYAFHARDLYAKPTFVNKEAGNPVIFMPWYDAKTGEGRYQTEYLAMRAEDADTKPKDVKLPNVNKRPKYTGIKVESLDDAKPVKTYIYDTRRDFSAKKAKGTNLEYFVKKGQRNQMDPDLQKFIIATTGHEDKLPAELAHSIKRGILTKQALFKWFRQVKTVNEFTFDLLNKYMFKNNYITSMAELDKILTLDPSFYWATAIVLRKEGLALESLLDDNDVDKFLSFINSLEGTKWKDKIEKLQPDFNKQWIYTGKGESGFTKEELDYSEKVQNYMRVLAMQWFNGTLAGAFYMAEAFRKVVRKSEEEARGILSIDAKKSNVKGDKSTTLADRLRKKNIIQGNGASVANDIIAVYESEMPTDKTEEEMIHDLSFAYHKRLCKEAGIDPVSTSEEKLMPIAQKVISYRGKLLTLSYDEITARYIELLNSQMTDTQPQGIFETRSQTSDRRRSIVDRIKRRGDYILKVVQEGKIAFTDLPKEIQDMFTLESATTESGKKTQTRVLKPDVYSVGRGRKKLPGVTDTTGRLNYVPKHNITEGNEAFRHDTTKIEANLEMLDNIVYAIKQVVGKKKGKGEAKKLYARGEKAAESLADAIRSQKVPKEKQTKTTEFKVTSKKKKRTSDTPNTFNIISGIDMPHVLYKILDTSFEDMANTLVQFASRDENGQLYDKSQFKPGEFDSRVKHEVSNWDAFYEANRDALLSLSRNDVLDIVEFFQRGASTMDGPANKLAAFEIFLLGYIVDAARHNINNWDFSDTEIEMVEKLYEQKASAHGSGLQAVQQMLKVVDPMKKVRQRMFDDWTEISDNDKDRLIKAVDSLQTETNADERKKKAAAVIETLKEFGKRKEIIPHLKHISTRLRELINAGTIERDTLPNDVRGLLSMGDMIAVGDLETLIERDQIFDALLSTNREIRRLVGPEIHRWSKAWWTRLGSQIKSWRYMAMLSGPATWMRNLISNAIVTGFNKTSDAIGGIIFTKKGYRKDQWNLAGTKISPEAKFFIDTYILKNPVFDPLYDMSSKYDVRQSKKVADERGLLVTLIAKAYEKQYAQGRRFDAKTMNVLAKFIDKRISDKKFVKFAAGRYFGKILTIEAERGNVDLSQGLSSEAMDLFAESVILANIDYMHKRSFAADFLDGIRDKYPAMYEALTFWQPFLNSSFNWFAESFKYTPFGLVASITRMCKLENQISKLSEKRAKSEMVADSRAAEFLVRRDVGKGVVGLLFSTFGIMLALSGRIRIDEDDDKFYLYVYEAKLDITNLFGSSSVLVGASIAQMWIEQSDGEPATFEEMISLVTDTMLDGFFATDILERHKWGGTWDDLLTETESVMRSFVPQMWQTIIACTNQEKIRYSSGFEGMWERWLNTFVPTQPFGNRKINPYTGELEDKYSLPIIGALLQKGILGPKVYWVEVSEVERMCRELGVNKNELTGELTVGDNKYELDRLALNKKYGELNKESLEKIKSQKHNVEMPNGTFKTLSWDKMDDKQRARVISRTMTQNAEIAKVYMWTQVMGKKFYASNSLWQILRQLGITRNVYKGDKGFVE